MPVYRVRMYAWLVLLSLSFGIFFLWPVTSMRPVFALSSPLLKAVPTSTCWMNPHSTACPGYAPGSGTSITITSQAYTIHFPNFIDFDVRANDSQSTITRASIFMTFGPVGDQQQGYGTLNASKPAHAVSFHYIEDTSHAHFHPPGTPVSYYWQIWDSAGNTLAEPAQQFTTVDTRFRWQHLAQGMLHVNWYNRSSDFGRIMLSQASASINRIRGNLGGGLIYPINLWIYASDADFHGSLTPGSYEWVGGQALPALSEASIVVMNASDTTLIRDMPHELTHLIFHQLTKQGIVAPTWFDEGLAVYNQIFHEPEMLQRFEHARDTHTLIRLSTITSGFPSNADQAYLAYAESWQLLNYMYNTFSQPKMTQLIKQMNDPKTNFDEDLQKVLGEDSLHLENSWYVYLHQQPLLSPEQLTSTARATSRTKLARPAAGQYGVNYFGVLIGIGVFLILTVMAGGLLTLINVRRLLRWGRKDVQEDGSI